MSNRSGMSVEDLAALKTFKNQLVKLSEELNGIYQFLKSDLTELSCHWQDRKFIEFDRNFSPKKEEIRKIAESYRTWADTSLQKTIEALEKYHGTSAS